MLNIYEPFVSKLLSSFLQLLPVNICLIESAFFHFSLRQLADKASISAKKKFFPAEQLYTAHFQFNKQVTFT